jgi:hypothetical protein
MAVTPEDSLRKHLDYVDRQERKFKLTTVFSGLVMVFTFGSFIRLATKHEDIYLVLIFVVVNTAIMVAAAAQGVHLRMTQLTNRVLKAIELAAAERKS